MATQTSFWQPLMELIETGGTVFVILLITSFVTVSLVAYKALQYRRARVGAHMPLSAALVLFEKGDKAHASEIFKTSSHFLAPVFCLGVDLEEQAGKSARLEAEAETRLAPLEDGFRVLDTVAQLAPLLGLLGTVLGMIEAFQALQSAGSQVDPSALAGGIWAALLTTAAGLTVAMPASVALTWFEARIDQERLFASHAFAVIGTAKPVTREPITEEPATNDRATTPETADAEKEPHTSDAVDNDTPERDSEQHDASLPGAHAIEAA